MRYFLLKNVDKDILFEGKRFAFEKTHFFHPTNSWWGVLARDGAEADLLAKVKQVEEIDLDDYKKLCSRRGDNLVIEFAMGDPLQPAPVVAKAEEVKVVAAEDVLKPKKTAK